MNAAEGTCENCGAAAEYDPDVILCAKCDPAQELVAALEVAKSVLAEVREFLGAEHVRLIDDYAPMIQRALDGARHPENGGG